MEKTMYGHVMKSGSAAAVFAAGFSLAACGTTAPGEGIVTGGSFGPDAAVVGSLGGDAGREALIGGVGSAGPQALSAAYGFYDYRTHSFGGYGFSTRCVQWSSYTGHCAVWRQS